jgi:hypothetical protein
LGAQVTRSEPNGRKTGRTEKMKQLLIIGLVLVAAMGSGCVDVEDSYKSITVVDKTAEVVRDGFGSSTDYKVLADDGTTYHTSWELYRTLEVNGTYTVQTCSRAGMWWILMVEG